MGDGISERSIRTLLDLIEARIRELDMADGQDMRNVQALEQCRCELETLRAATQTPQDVMQRARLAGIL